MSAECCGGCGSAPSRAQPWTGPEPKPAALDGAADSALAHLDVRDDVRRGQEPFFRIMRTVKALQPGQVLVLRAPFEPRPLYDVLAGRGFAHWTERHAGDDWSVWFYREADRVGLPTPAEPPGAAAARIVVDVRGLEPPQPMVRVLEALDTLGDGQRLEVLHDRRPLFLYPQLDDRGFVHATDEPEPGLVRITICRGAQAR